MTTTRPDSRRNRQHSHDSESEPTHRHRLVSARHASGLAKIPSRILLGLWLVPWLGACASPGETEDRAATKHDQVQPSRNWHFDGDATGKVPSGWRITETKPTKALATWQVVRDETASSQTSVPLFPSFAWERGILVAR